MLSRLARLIVLSSFLVSMGLPGAALQVFAWARMAVSFARHDTVAVSLEKTFDGRHPCAICFSLKKAGDPSSLAAAPTHSRLGFVSPTGAPRAARVAVVWDVAPPSFAAPEPARRPSSPPPKAVLA